MGAHVAGLCERLAAVFVRTMVGLVAGVVVEMSLEMVLLGEGFRADGT